MNGQDIASAARKFTGAQHLLQGTVELLLLAHSDNRANAAIKRGVIDQIACVEHELACLRDAVGHVAGDDGGGINPNPAG